MKQSPRHDDRRRFRERCRPQRRMFHVKHSVPVPTGARTRKRTTTHQPRTNDHRQQAGCHPSAAPRSVSHGRSHLGPTRPLARAPAPRRRPRARRRCPTQTDTPGPQAREAPKSTALARPQNPQALTPASRAASARGPHASVRGPRRARSTR